MSLPQDIIDISVNDKEMILKENITLVKRSIYNQVIKIRVADRVGDNSMKKAAEKEAEKLEKILDGYREELKALTDAGYLSRERRRVDESFKYYSTTKGLYWIRGK